MPFQGMYYPGHMESFAAAPTVDESFWSRASYWLLLGAIFCMTFSIAAGQTFLLLCAVAWIVGLKMTHRWPRVPLAAWGGVAFLVVAVLSLVIQPSLARGWGRLSRVLWVLTVPLGAGLISSGNRRVAVLKALTLGCLVLSLHTLLWHPVLARRGMASHESWAPDFWHALIHLGSMTDGQILMLGLMGTLGVIWIARRRGERTLWWWLALALNGLAFIINYKRGSWLCGVMGIATFFMLQRSWRSVFLMVLAVAAVLAVPSVRMRLSQIQDEVQSNNAGRMTMWTRVAPGIIKEHFWGIGYGQMTNRKMRQYAPRVERERSHLHSNIAQVLAETGWVGLGVYLSWMVMALMVAMRRTVQHRRADPAARISFSVFMVMILILMIHGAVEYNFGDTEILVFLCVFMGIACVPPDETPSTVRGNA